ncbi:hypothetical protein Y032_0285g1368 [Ancylostoma ceylanicum]|uniref:Uncharacterized protein n=1 Tax=Ancylostoma ceylanicum TaxID=53326 RepID=A0A016S7C2_9BILA|nr:hypothetical protein Y032_0285g1368 [Ancylostoma ceylanicum]
MSCSHYVGSDSTCSFSVAFNKVGLALRSWSIFQGLISPCTSQKPTTLWRFERHTLCKRCIDGMSRVPHRSSKFYFIKQNFTNSLTAHNISFILKTQQRSDTDPSQIAWVADVTGYQHA